MSGNGNATANRRTVVVAPSFSIVFVLAPTMCDDDEKEEEEEATERWESGTTKAELEAANNRSTDNKTSERRHGMKVCIL